MHKKTLQRIEKKIRKVGQRVSKRKEIQGREAFVSDNYYFDDGNKVEEEISCR